MFALRGISQLLLRSRTFLIALCGGLAVLALISITSIHAYRLQAWRGELAEARKAIESGRLGRARDMLSRLADHWTNDGEVFLLLGDCELARAGARRRWTPGQECPNAHPTTRGRPPLRPLI